MKFDLSGDEIKVYDFNALQAYKIGRHMEEEGIAFYKNLIKENDELKESFTDLLNEEKEHLNILQDKIDKITEEKEDGFEEESLEDFLNTNVFSHLKEIKTKKDIFKDRKKSIEFGITVENRSIRFYEAILKNTEDDSGKEVIKELIKQEQEHLLRLKGLT